jgi:integrase
MNRTNKYTPPKIFKGKKPTKIPNGSTLAKEWAKNDWYINYSFNGKQYRIKDNLNRIKDHKEKLYQADVLLESIKTDLKKGYDPSNPEGFIEQMITEKINLSDAIIRYIAELATYARPKTVGSYKSKLHYFSEVFPNQSVKSFTTNQIQEYIFSKIHSSEPAKLLLNGKSYELKKAIPWAPNTVRSAKGIFRAFFQWCIKNNYYLGDNPVSKIYHRLIRSEVKVKSRNTLFSKEDITKLMNYLDDNDKPTAFFARMIYSTCMRPGEICQLRLKDIDLQNKQIIIPLDVTKNTKKTSVEVIDIEPHLYKELMKLKFENYKTDFYLTSKSENIIGEVTIGNNKPYRQVIKALKILNLNEKGYTLYSFKHFSNLQRFTSGWTLAEIMKANRHSSISMTEKYLKGINKVTDISKKEVPKI